MAVTGEEAEAAIALADQLATQVEAAGKLPIADMQGEVKALTQTVSGASLWAVCGRVGLRGRKEVLHCAHATAAAHAAAVFALPRLPAPPLTCPARTLRRPFAAGAVIPTVRKAALAEQLQGLTRIILDDHKKVGSSCCVATMFRRRRRRRLPLLHLWHLSLECSSKACWSARAGSRAVSAAAACCPRSLNPPTLTPSLHPQAAAANKERAVAAAVEAADAAAAGGAKFLVSKLEVGLDAKAIQASRGGPLGSGVAYQTSVSHSTVAA